MTRLEDAIKQLGVLPVIKIQDASVAEDLATALIDGGLPAAEITFRTDAAEEALSRMAKKYPEMLLGAGTVLTVEQADKAMAVGARFLVSPGLNPTVVHHCKEKGYPIIPGICTPSELEMALSFGLETVKFFPAEASGGLAMIQALSAPYGKVHFMPTGGINVKNLPQYLASNKVLCCGGSWIVPENKLNARDFDGIRALALEAASLVKQYRG